MASNRKSEAISHNSVLLSDGAEAKLAELFGKYSDLCINADALAEPTRSIAKFVKKETIGRREDGNPG